MRPQSAKSKGRRLQQWAAEQYKGRFTHLEGNDIRSLSMGASGDDLILSPAALKVLPYNFEMKNCENFQLWATLRQTEARFETEEHYPCIVAKRNRVDPLSIIPFGHYAHLLRFEMAGVREDGVLPAQPFNPRISAGTLLSLLAIQRDVSTGVAPAAVKAGVSFALLDARAVKDLGPRVMQADRWVLQIEDSARFNFWETWDRLVETSKTEKKKRGWSFDRVLAFNRGDADATIYVAMPFELHMRLLEARWKHVRQKQLREMMAAAAQ